MKQPDESWLEYILRSADVRDADVGYLMQFARAEAIAGVARCPRCGCQTCVLDSNANTACRCTGCRRNLVVRWCDACEAETMQAISRRADLVARVKLKAPPSVCRCGTTHSVEAKRSSSKAWDRARWEHEFNLRILREAGHGALADEGPEWYRHRNRYWRRVCEQGGLVAPDSGLHRGLRDGSVAT